jgi:putative FmdB family regulatory protein
MPIYEYQCLECGKRFEKLVRSRNSSLELECPKCGGRKVRKLLSAFGIHASGSASEPICPTCEALRR